MSIPGRFLIMSAVAALLVKWASVINPSLHGADSFETTVVVCIVIICGVIALYFWSKKAAKETKEKNQGTTPDLSKPRYILRISL